MKNVILILALGFISLSLLKQNEITQINDKSIVTSYINADSLNKEICLYKNVQNLSIIGPRCDYLISRDSCETINKIPPNLSGLKKLTFLGIYNSKRLSGFNYLTHLSQLRVLDLSHGRDIDFNDLGKAQLENIDSLILIDCDLRAVDCNLISDLKLKYLVLDDNPLLKDVDYYQLGLKMDSCKIVW